MGQGFKVGFGHDVHQLVAGRPLIIGGISIEHPKGALGHSDADVLLHAIIDALLGAAGLGDIGTRFPDNDPQYKDADSQKLLIKVVKLIEENGYTVGNIDSTVVLQKPKINTYIPQIRKQISNIIGIPEADISVKAKTSEHLGFIGREEGVAAYAIVLLQSK